MAWLSRWKYRARKTLQDSLWGSIVKVGNIYYMFYVKYDGVNYRRIRRATSSNLINWTDQGSVSFIADDLTHRTAPAILKDVDGSSPETYDDKYWLICQEFGDLTQFKLYYAKSITGTWTYEKDVLLRGNAGDWDNGRIHTACFFKDEDNYNIYYQGQKAADRKWRIGYATCSIPNGCWEKAGNNPRLEPTLTWEGNAVGDPCIRRECDTYYLFYTGNLAHNCFNSYATSLSLSGTWNKLDEIITRKGVSYPEIVKHPNNRYYLNGDDLKYTPHRKFVYLSKIITGPYK